MGKTEYSHKLPPCQYYHYHRKYHHHDHQEQLGWKDQSAYENGY